MIERDQAIINQPPPPHYLKIILSCELVYGLSYDEPLVFLNQSIDR
jgi:hypothetical protein